MNRIFVCRSDYPTYYKYRKAIKEYREQGYVIAPCCGGVWCFADVTDYDTWKNQK